MLSSADQLFKDADFIFQQDLAPAHTAKSTKSWLNDHVLVCLTGQCKARLDRPNDGSRSAGEGLCVLQSFLFTTQQEH